MLVVRCAGQVDRLRDYILAQEKADKSGNAVDVGSPKGDGAVKRSRGDSDSEDAPPASKRVQAGQATAASGAGGDDSSSDDEFGPAVPVAKKKRGVASFIISAD